MCRQMDLSGDLPHPAVLVSPVDGMVPLVATYYYCLSLRLAFTCQPPRLLDLLFSSPAWCSRWHALTYAPSHTRAVAHRHKPVSSGPTPAVSLKNSHTLVHTHREPLHLGKWSEMEFNEKKRTDCSAFLCVYGNELLITQPNSTIHSNLGYIKAFFKT